jgi:hypothetical protein
VVLAEQPGMASRRAQVLCLLLAHAALAIAATYPIPSCDKFAFIKTPKTGSTTFSNILFRTAVVHGKRVFKQFPGHNITLNYNEAPRYEGRHDIVMSHFATHCVRPGEYEKLLQWYGSVLGTDNFTMMASVREPVSRYVSHLKYFTFPDMLASTGRKWTTKEVLEAKLNVNVIGCVFGIYTEEAAHEFVKSALFKRTLFLPSEHYPKAVAMVMARCGWELQHSAFMKNNPTVSNWDVPVKEYAKEMAAANSIDMIIYSAALQQFHEQWEAAGNLATMQMARLARCNKELRSHCGQAAWRTPECRWYTVDDNDFYNVIKTQKGILNMTAPVVDGHSVDDMQLHGTQLCRQF